MHAHRLTGRLAVLALGVMLAGCSATAQDRPTAPPGWNSVACGAIEMAAGYLSGAMVTAESDKRSRELAEAYIDSLPEWDPGAPLEAALRHVLVVGDVVPSWDMWRNTVGAAYGDLTRGYGVTCRLPLEDDGVPRYYSSPRPS